MKRAKYLILAVFISPECLFVLVTLGLFLFFPDTLIVLGAKIKSDEEVWKHLPALTLSISGIAFKLSSKLRAPLESSSNKALYDWPSYRLLVDRVIVSLLFVTAGGVMSITLWVFAEDWSSELVGAIFVGSSAVVASTAFIMLLAYQKLRELIEKYSE